MPYLFVSIAALILAATPVLSSSNPNDGLEDAVRRAFADAPVMIAVAKCESGYRQFSVPEVVLRGGPQKQYVGIFQIDVNIHTPRALSMGHDILTAAGNIAYARYLFDAQGTRPWRGCVPKTVAPAQAAVPVTIIGAAIVSDLKLGMVDAQIRTVQQLLNANGFPVASNGPGSPGNETTRFGALTLDAVRRFQCAKGIVCKGDASTTGYGRVGPRTRAALNGLAS